MGLLTTSVIARTGGKSVLCVQTGDAGPLVRALREYANKQEWEILEEIVVALLLFLVEKYFRNRLAK